MTDVIRKQVTLNTVELDFGTLPRYAMGFSVSAPATVGQKVFVCASGDIATGGDGDDREMDGITVAARVTATDTIGFYVSANPGPIAGNVKVSYFLA